MPPPLFCPPSCPEIVLPVTVAVPPAEDAAAARRVAGVLPGDRAAGDPPRRLPSSTVLPPSPYVAEDAAAVAELPGRVSREIVLSVIRRVAASAQTAVDVARAGEAPPAPVARDRAVGDRHGAGDQSTMPPPLSRPSSRRSYCR